MSQQSSTLELLSSDYNWKIGSEGALSSLHALGNVTVGFLDGSNNTIITSSNITTTELLVKDTKSTNKVSLLAPELSSSYTITLPDNKGTRGQYLQTDGNGVLNWTSETGSTQIKGDTVSEGEYMTSDTNWIHLTNFDISYVPIYNNSSIYLQYKIPYESSIQTDQRISFRITRYINSNDKNPPKTVVEQDINLGPKNATGGTRNIYISNIFNDNHHLIGTTIEYKVEMKIEREITVLDNDGNVRKSGVALSKDNKGSYFLKEFLDDPDLVDSLIEFKSYDGYYPGYLSLGAAVHNSSDGTADSYELTINNSKKIIHTPGNNNNNNVHNGNHNKTKVPLENLTPHVGLTQAANNTTVATSKLEVVFNDITLPDGENVNANVSLIGNAFPVEMQGVYEIKVERGAFVEPGVVAIQVVISDVGLWITKFSHPTYRSQDKVLSCTKLSPEQCWQNSSGNILLALEVAKDPKPLFENDNPVLTGDALEQYLTTKLKARGHTENSADLKIKAFTSAMNETGNNSNHKKGLLASSQTLYQFVFDYENGKMMLLNQHNVVDDVYNRYPVYEMLNILLEGSGLYLDLDPVIEVYKTNSENNSITIRDIPISTMIKIDPDNISQYISLCNTYEGISDVDLNLRNIIAAYYLLTAMATTAFADVAQYDFLTAIASYYESLYTTYDADNSMSSPPYEWTVEASMVYAEDRPYSSLLSIAAGVEHSDFQYKRSVSGLNIWLGQYSGVIVQNDLDYSRANIHKGITITSPPAKRWSVDKKYYSISEPHDDALWRADVATGLLTGIRHSQVEGVWTRMNDPTINWDNGGAYGLSVFYETTVDGKLAWVCEMLAENTAEGDPWEPYIIGTCHNDSMDELAHYVFQEDGHTILKWKYFHCTAFTTLTEATPQGHIGPYDPGRVYEMWQGMLNNDGTVRNATEQYFWSTDPQWNAGWSLSLWPSLSGKGLTWWEDSTEEERIEISKRMVRIITDNMDKGWKYAGGYFGVEYCSPFKLSVRDLTRLSLVNLPYPTIPNLPDIKTPVAYDNVITLTTSFTDPISNLVYALNPRNGTVDIAGSPIYAVWDVLTTDTDMYLFATNMYAVANPLSESCEGVDSGDIGQVVVLKLDTTGATVPTQMTMFSTLYDIEILSNKTMQDAITEFEGTIDINNTELMDSYVSLEYIAADWITDVAAAKTAIATAVCEPLRRGYMPGLQNIILYHYNSHKHNTRVPLENLTPHVGLTQAAYNTTVATSKLDVTFNDITLPDGENVNANVSLIGNAFPVEMQGVYEIKVERGAFVDPGVLAIQVVISDTRLWITKFSHPTYRSQDKVLSCTGLSPEQCWQNSSGNILLALEDAKDPKPLFESTMAALTGDAVKNYLINVLTTRGHTDNSARIKAETFTSAMNETGIISNDKKGLLASSQTLYQFVFDYENGKMMLLNQHNVVDDVYNRYPVYEMLNILLEGSGLYVDLDSVIEVYKTNSENNSVTLRDTAISTMIKIDSDITEYKKQTKPYLSISEDELNVRKIIAAYYLLTAMATAVPADTELSAFLTALAADYGATYSSFDADNPMSSPPYDWTANNEAIIFVEGRSPYSTYSITSGLDESPLEKIRNVITTGKVFESVIPGLELTDILISSSNVYTIAAISDDVLVRIMATDAEGFGGTPSKMLFSLDLNGYIRTTNQVYNSGTSEWVRDTGLTFNVFHNTVIDGKVVSVSIATVNEPGLDRFDGTKEVGNNKCDEMQVIIFDSDGQGGIAYKIFFNIAFTIKDGEVQSKSSWYGVYKTLYGYYGEWSSFFFNMFKVLTGDPEWYSKADTRDATHSDAVETIVSLGDKGIFITPYFGVPYYSPFKNAVRQLCRLLELTTYPTVPHVNNMKTPVPYETELNYKTAFLNADNEVMYKLNPENGSIDSIDDNAIYAVWAVTKTETHSYLFATKIDAAVNILPNSCEGVDGGDIGVVAIFKLNTTGTSVPSEMEIFSHYYDIVILSTKTMGDAITEFEASTEYQAIIDITNIALMESYVEDGYITEDWNIDVAAAKTKLATVFCNPLSRGHISGVQEILNGSSFIEVASLFYPSVNIIMDQNIPLEFQGTFTRNGDTIIVENDNVINYDNDVYKCIGSSTEENFLILVKHSFETPVGWSGGGLFSSAQWNNDLDENLDMTTSTTKLLFLVYTEDRTDVRYIKTYVDTILTGVALWSEIRGHFAAALPSVYGDTNNLNYGTGYATIIVDDEGEFNLVAFDDTGLWLSNQPTGFLRQSDSLTVNEE